MKPKFITKIVPYLFLTFLSSFIFFSCEKNEVIQEETRSMKAIKLSDRPVDNELMYAQHLIQNELNYRVIKDEFTLALIQREIEIDGFDTAERSDVITQRIEENMMILNFLNEIVGPIGGDGGPIGPPRPGLPCEPTIGGVNFMELGEGDLNELGIIILGCKPIPEFSSIQKVVFNHDMGRPYEVIVSQDGHQVGGIINSNYDDFDQEVLTVKSEYHGNATLTLFLNTPIFDRLRFDIPIQNNN